MGHASVKSVFVCEGGLSGDRSVREVFLVGEVLVILFWWTFNDVGFVDTESDRPEMRRVPC